VVKKRAHAHGRSHSVRPVSKKPPVWLKYEPEEVEALVVKLGKDLTPPSRIGVILRDQHGIPLVKQVVGKPVTKVLEGQGLQPKIPEDLENLLRKAGRLGRHIEKHRSDSVNRHSLQHIEAKIHRLTRYYKRSGVLPKNWEYKALVLSTK